VDQSGRPPAYSTVVAQVLPPVPGKQTSKEIVWKNEYLRKLGGKGRMKGIDHKENIGKHIIPSIASPKIMDYSTLDNCGNGGRQGDIQLDVISFRHPDMTKKATANGNPDTQNTNAGINLHVHAQVQARPECLFESSDEDEIFREREKKKRGGGGARGKGRGDEIRPSAAASAAERMANRCAKVVSLSGT